MNIKISKILLLLGSTFLISSFVIIVLEKNRFINLYQKPIGNTTLSGIEDKPETNRVNYGPAKPQDISDASDKKKEIIQNSNENIVNSISVSFSAANQDFSGGPLEIKALVSGTSSGRCELSLTQNNEIKTFYADVINLGTYFSCAGFTVPYQNLSLGGIKIKLVVINGTLFGEAETSAEIKQ